MSLSPITRREIPLQGLEAELEDQIIREIDIRIKVFYRHCLQPPGENKRYTLYKEIRKCEIPDSQFNEHRFALYSPVTLNLLKQILLT